MASNDSTVISTQVGQSIIVTLGSDLSGDMLNDVKSVALKDVHRYRAQAVIFEVSALQFIDTYEFNELIKIVKMVRVLGAVALFTGFRPGIVMYLIESGVDLSEIFAFRGLDEAEKYLARFQNAHHD